MRVTLYFVGFYSAFEPGAVQRWRPKDEDPELCSRTEADKRFAYLEGEMKARRKVDGLKVASIALFDEKNNAIRAMTFDGTEAKSKPEDVGCFLRTTRQVRGAA